MKPPRGDRVTPPREGSVRALRDLAARIRRIDATAPQTGHARPGVRAVIQGRSAAELEQAARKLATAARVDLFRVDLAGVVARYIGETEKNLDRIFQSAQESGAVLFFTEADALFGPRSAEAGAADRHAGLDAGFILHRLGRFRCAAIFATSSGLQIDPAVRQLADSVIDLSQPET